MTRRFGFIIFCLCVSHLVLATESYTLSEHIHKTDDLERLVHVGEGRWDNYLSMSLPFPPVASLFKQLLIDRKSQLTSRGEAHITVITPVEFWDVLRPAGVSMDDINSAAENLKIQSSKFLIECLGEGKALINDRTESTFYLVVRSEKLIELREAISRIYYSKEKAIKGAFVPNKFYPHITVGFTGRDLHLSDGVKKNSDTCIKKIREI